MDVPLRGKDDDFSKLKKARKVQFGDEGDWLKGGKGGKAANGGKHSVAKESTKHELSIDPELLKNSQCVMDCEAADILQGIQEQMVLLSRDPTIKLPVSFDRGLLYAKTGARYANPMTVRQVLEVLKCCGVSELEICMIANICPETIDEVFALVPSLKAKRNKISEALKDVLSELFKLRVSPESPKE